MDIAQALDGSIFAFASAPAAVSIVSAPLLSEKERERTLELARELDADECRYNGSVLIACPPTSLATEAFAGSYARRLLYLEQGQGFGSLCVMACVRNHRGQILLGRRSRGVDLRAGLWSLVPGGIIEPEEEPLAALERELVEETGLKEFETIQYHGRLHHPGDNVCFLYLATTAEEPLCPDPREHSELGWFDLHQLPAPLDDLSALLARGLIADTP